MSSYRLLGFTALLGFMVGCDSPTAQTPLAVDITAAQSVTSANGPKASGGGQYLISIPGLGELPGQFSFDAIQTDADGSAKGNLRYTLDFLGQHVEFRGEVTCVTFDHTEGRAWIGGVITQNESEHPSFRDGEIFQPGKDIWFRVLDEGEGVVDPDRTTFVGFEGGAGIITSAEYCDVQAWPEGNARTWPVTAGNVQVH